MRNEAEGWTVQNLPRARIAPSLEQVREDGLKQAFVEWPQEDQRQVVAHAAVVAQQQAVEPAPQVLPGLILMDLNLPVLNGFEATRLIHRSAETRDIPIVAVSAQCVGEYRQRALAAGCLECVQKPMNFSMLRSVVGRYLGAS